MKQVVMVGLIASMLSGMSMRLQAEEAAPAPAPEWKGEGELGYVAARGNADTKTISSKLKMTYASGNWSHEFGIATLQASSEDPDTGEEEETADRFQFTGQTNYSFSERSYTFGAVRYEEDEYSGYDHQSTLAAGYGYHFLNEETHKLSAEIGAGKRRSELIDTGETETETILRLRVTHGWQFTESSKWTNDLLIEAGDENTFSEFVTGLKVDINKSFAVKISHAIRQNSEVPPDREETDTLTTVNLVFGF
jgi:putative salt-induced outer membrane protein